MVSYNLSTIPTPTKTYPGEVPSSQTDHTPTALYQNNMPCDHLLLTTTATHVRDRTAMFQERPTNMMPQDTDDDTATNDLAKLHTIRPGIPHDLHGYSTDIDLEPANSIHPTNPSNMLNIPDNPSTRPRVTACTLENYDHMRSQPRQCRDSTMGHSELFTIRNYRPYFTSPIAAGYCSHNGKQHIANMHTNDLHTVRIETAACITTNSLHLCYMHHDHERSKEGVKGKSAPPCRASESERRRAWAARNRSVQGKHSAGVNFSKVVPRDYLVDDLQCGTIHSDAFLLLQLPLMQKR